MGTGVVDEKYWVDSTIQNILHAPYLRLNIFRVGTYWMRVMNKPGDIW